ncbi:MAG: glycosyltransferase family 9 protein [Candidatus Nanoarchaeia archaeon]|nr:glycosyltransferase family 9 protein [Candidatus Nanoarchaeia archaeon]
MKPLRSKLMNLLREINLELNYLPYSFRKNINLNNPKKFLIVAHWLIGDLIVLTPSIKVIKDQYPQAKIDIIISKGMKDVLSLNPNINKIFEINKKEIEENLKWYSEKLKKEKYDVGIIFFEGDKKTSRLLKEADIPIRIGCAKSGVKRGKGYYLTRKTKPDHKEKQYLFYNLDVLKTINIFPKEIKQEIFVDKKDEEKFRKIMGNKLKIVVHAVPNHKTHIWNNKRFAEVADYLIERKKAAVFFTGAKKDAPLNDEIISLMKNKAQNLAGGSIKDFFGIIKNSDLVISVDTSAMHVAATFNIPVIALMGASPYKLWKPYSNRAVTIFHPEKCTECRLYKCFRKGKRYMECMDSITKDEVIQSCDLLLKENKK